MYGNFLPFVSLRTLALGIALLSLAQNNAAQFVPASSPIADPADTRFTGVKEDWIDANSKRRTGCSRAVLY